MERCSEGTCLILPELIGSYQHHDNTLPNSYITIQQGPIVGYLKVNTDGAWDSRTKNVRMGFII